MTYPELEEVRESAMHRSLRALLRPLAYYQIWIITISKGT